MSSVYSSQKAKDSGLQCRTGQVVSAERDCSGYDTTREEETAFVVKHNLTIGADGIFVNSD